MDRVISQGRNLQGREIQREKIKVLLSGKLIYKASKVARESHFFRLANLLTSTGSNIQMSSEEIIRNEVDTINDPKN